MKTKLFLFSLLCFSFSIISTAQVGVGNTNPQAQLDISASNTSSPSNLDGILIPRMSNLPTVGSMTAAQDGMLVFYTGSGNSGKGFYYWNQTSTSWIFLASGSKNTLDDAYDEGGPGTGKDITADNGALRVNGTDGILVTGTLGSGNTIDDEITGDGIRMFFNPHKAAYRGGMAEDDWWIDARIGNYSFSHGRKTWVSGDYSVAFGRETSATGEYSFANGFDTNATGERSFVHGYVSDASGDYGVGFGQSVYASGDYSFAQGSSATSSNMYSLTMGQYVNSYADHAKAIGLGLIAESYGEIVLGLYDTDYSENSDSAFDSGDRLFTIGNGTSTTARSNALTIYKSGLMNINDAYNMPLTDGASGYVMASDGAGNVNWTDPSSLISADSDWHELGTGTAPNSINDNIYTNGTVGIGHSGTATGRLHVNGNYTDASQVVYLSSSGDGSGAGSMNNIYNLLSTNDVVNSRGIINRFQNTDVTRSTGIRNEFLTTNGGILEGVINYFDANALATTRIGVNNAWVGGGANNNYGVRNESLLPYTVTGNIYGMFNNIQSDGNGERYGIYSLVSGLGSGAKYGTYSEIISTAGGTHYGVYSEVLNTSGYAGYFVGRFNLGEQTSNRYFLPGTDGTNGQIMATNGAGVVSFVDPSTVFTDTNTDNQTLGLAGTTLSISGGNNVNLNAINTDNQTLGLAGTTLSITGGNNVNLGAINTDDQTIDNFSLSGTTLRLSLENDGQPLQTVDLSSLQDGTGNDWTTSGNAGTNPTTNFLGTTDNQDLAIRTNNVEKVRITAKGQIETTQLQSVWIGDNAGNSVTSGSRNTFVGRNAGLSVTSGLDNTAIGGLTLSALTTGQDNTAIGLGSLLDLTSGNGNTFVGEQSGENLSSGSYNTVIGHTAGENMNGSYNIFLGFEAGQSLTGSHRLVIDNDNNGTSSFIYGEMDNEILRANAEVEITRNSSGTVSNLELIETGANDGSRLRFSNAVETTNNWLLYGRADDTDADSRLNIFYSGSGNVMEIYGDNTVEVNGQLSVNLNNPTYAIHLPNNATIGTGQGRANAWTTYSDNRVKSNQSDLKNGLLKVLQMRPKTYFHHNGNIENGRLSLDRSGEQTLGFIAQELYKVLPEAVQKPHNENEELWSINYDKVIPVTVKAIQELNTKIESLEAENKSLKDQLGKLQQLEARLNALENNVKTNLSNSSINTSEE